MKSCIPRGIAALVFGIPFALQAQTPPKPASPPPATPTDEEISEEIVVTAQKRATALQDVPFSVAAVTNEDIKQSGATNLVEIARNVPGLYITDLGPGQSQVAIRGISAGQVVRDQPGVKESVGIYLASRCCAVRRAPCLARVRLPAPCVTSPRSPRSATSAARPKSASMAWTVASGAGTCMDR